MAWFNSHEELLVFAARPPFRLDADILSIDVQWWMAERGRTVHSNQFCTSLKQATLKTVAAPLLTPGSKVCSKCFSVHTQDATGTTSVVGDYLDAVNRVIGVAAKMEEELAYLTRSTPYGKLVRTANAHWYFASAAAIAADLGAPAQAYLRRYRTEIDDLRAALSPTAEAVLREEAALPQVYVTDDCGFDALIGEGRAGLLRSGLSSAFRTACRRSDLTAVLTRTVGNYGIVGEDAEVTVARYETAGQARLDMLASEAGSSIVVGPYRPNLGLSDLGLRSTIWWWFAPDGVTKFRRLPSMLVRALSGGGTNSPTWKPTVVGGDGPDITDDVLDTATALLGADMTPVDALDFARLVPVPA